MILIIWLLRCSLVSLGLRVLRRKLLKGAVLQVAVVNALAACFHHLLWVVGSKEIWWVDTGKGAEEATGTGCRWEQEASVWQQALQREVLYFPFFPLSKLVSLIPCPPTTIIMTFFQTLLCHPTYQSCLMFVLLLFLVWSLVLVELNSGNWDSHRLFPHSTSYPTGTLPGEIGSHPVSYSLCKTDVETVFWPLYRPCPKQKLILLWREKKTWKPWSSLFEQLVRKKMVTGCLLPPQCQVVFMAEHMTNEATLSLSMRQYKKAIQKGSAMCWLSTQGNL